MGGEVGMWRCDAFLPLWLRCLLRCMRWLRWLRCLLCLCCLLCLLWLWLLCRAFAFQPLPEGLDVFEGMLYAVFPHSGAPQCRQVCAGVQCLADVARQRADVGALRAAHADVERHGVGVEVQEF